MVNLIIMSKKFTPEEEHRIYELCKQAVLNIPLKYDDQEFIYRMYKKNSEEYGNIHQRAKDEAISEYTKMFG